MQGRRRRPSGAPQGSYSHVYCSWLVWPIWDAIEKVWGGCRVGEGGPAVEPPRVKNHKPGHQPLHRSLSLCCQLYIMLHTFHCLFIAHQTTFCFSIFVESKKIKSSGLFTAFSMLPNILYIVKCTELYRWKFVYCTKFIMLNSSLLCTVCCTLPSSLHTRGSLWYVLAEIPFAML